MTKSSPPPVERAFTLIEVLVVIAIIIGLAAILIPSLNSALESAKATKDLSNLRQIGALMQTYLNDKDGILPGNQRLLRASARSQARSFTRNTSRAEEFSNRLLTSGPLPKGQMHRVSYGINANMYAAVSRDRWTI